MNRRIVILAEGRFGLLTSKTANQAIRYIPGEVVGVIDSRLAGRTAEAVLGFGGQIPVFADLESSMAVKPATLLIGIAPTGGRLPEEWRPTIEHAILHGLNVVSGLHTYLSDDKEFSLLARQKNVSLSDLRKVPPEYEVVSRGRWRYRKAKTILTVGTDCNVGKMTASLEIHRDFLARRLKSDFIATGQTGILLAGRGVCVDSLAGDYISGAIEREIDNRAGSGPDYMHIEGQGSLTHQGYSAVTLGLLHGVMPDAMIIVHHPARIKDDYGLSLQDITRFIRLHEEILGPFKKSKVVGIALNTAGMGRQDVEASIKDLEAETGLPAGDVLTPGVGKLSEAIIQYLGRTD